MGVYSIFTQKSSHALSHSTDSVTVAKRPAASLPPERADFSDIELQGKVSCSESLLKVIGISAVIGEGQQHSHLNVQKTPYYSATLKSVLVIYLSLAEYEILHKQKVKAGSHL